MWKYVKPYLYLGIIAGILMIGEVACDLVQPTLMSSVIDDGVLGGGDIATIIRLGVIMLVATFAGAAFGSSNGIFSTMCNMKIGNAIRKDLFAKILSITPLQVKNLQTGSLITRVTNDIVQVQRYVELYMRGIVRTGFTLVGSLACMFMLNTTFGLISLVAVPIGIVALVICLKKAVPLFARLQTELDALNGILQEDLSGIRAIKACVHELHEKARFGAANSTLTNTQLTALLIFATLSPVMNALMYLTVTAVLVIGNYQVQAGELTPGIIMAAITYTTQLLNAISRLVMLSQEYSRGQASWHRVKAVLELEPAISSGTYTQSAAADVTFEHVGYAYPQSEQAALSDITFSVSAGETLAIMGSTGSGKSTLVKLIARFMDATTGTVLVGGVDVREWDAHALRENIAYVGQKAEISGLSVFDTVAWGKPDATREEVIRALETAQAWEFVSALPQGLDTILGERGMSLSGGQRQRLSLARAVIKCAPILILDDATSALDLKTERAFFDALDKAKPNLTKIIVAQRISTVASASRILVLDEGRMQAIGTHTELLRTSETYSEIYESQMGEAPKEVSENAS